MIENMPPADDTTALGRRSWLPRVLLTVLFIAAVLVLAWLFRDKQILLALAGWEDQIRSFYREHPLVMLLAAFLLYVLVAGLSIPGALPLSLTYGWLFGFLPAAIVVSFASTSGASIAFLLSRYLVGEWVQRRFSQRLAWFNAAVEREGALFLLTLRLVPLAPFWLVNLLAGLTKIRVATFWWVSQLGMLPGTLVFIYASSRVKTLQEIAERGIWSFVEWQMFMALSMLVIFPLAARLIVGRLRRSTPLVAEASTGEPAGSPAEKR